MVTVSLSVRAAQPEDVDRLQAIREEVAIDLLQRGIPWNPNATRREHLESWVAQGALWVATISDEPLGMVAVWWSDPAGYWPKADLAAYLHDLMMSPTLRGERMGERLLAWAESFVRGRGRRWLRLDCDAANDRLRRYYEEAGYEHVGIHAGAALFQKRLI